MKKGWLIAAIFILFIMVVPNAFAQENVWDMANSPQYGKKAAGMFGRGLLNVATCFVDIIVQTVEGTKTGPPFVGTLTGLGGGLGCTALRVGSGALDVVTFWVPGFNGFPVSRSYNNCLLADEEKSTLGAADPYAAPASSTYVPPFDENPKTSGRDNDAMQYVKK